MVMTGIFVDDEDKTYARLLNTRGELTFDTQDVMPLTDQSQSIRAAKPDIVALDYRLDEVTEGIDAGHTYKGSALAQLLRDATIEEPQSDFGIVLVSNEQKLKKLFHPDKTAHDLFDAVYGKEELTRDRARVSAEVLALAVGYQVLRGLAAPYPPAVVLSAGADEIDQLEAQEIAVSFADASAPHIVSKIVLKNFIRRAGVLVDHDDARALLGLDAVSFGRLESILNDAGCDYRGIFNGGWPRWWRSRLEGWAFRMLGVQLLDLTGHERAGVIHAVTGLDMQPAASPWNDRTDEYFAFACSSCRRPTETRHSLAAFDPLCPRYGSRRRVCWDCVQNDRYIAEGIDIDEADAGLVNDIKRRGRDA